MAIRIYNLLANGMGGLDWSGLPLWCGALGVTDVDGLLCRLEVIRGHRPPQDKTPSE